MLRRLTTYVIFRTGIHTQNIDSAIKSFRPTSEDSCIEQLQMIQKRKEYLSVSQASQSFIDRIEYFILRKQKNLTSKSLFIYQNIKQLQMLNPSFKYGILSKLQQQMAAILQNNLLVNNNQLQVLLWFIYREFPYLRDTQFQEIAQQHTLKLFQMHEFMNQEPTLPTWEPYLRITTMLKCLGHEPQIRSDITMENILKINSHYLPFLDCLFPTQQSCKQMRQKSNIHQPFLVHICNRYIEADQMKYDAYLQHVETIDNQQAGEEIERTFDTLSWNNFTELLNLYMKSYQMEEFDENLVYKLAQLFWRICETKKLPFESAVQIIQLISENPACLGGQQNSICSRVLEAISDISIVEFAFVPQSAVIALFRAVSAVQKIANNDKREFFQNVLNKISKKIEWDPDNISQLQQIVKKIDENLSKKINTTLKISE